MLSGDLLLAKELLNFIDSYKSFTIVPDTSLDALLAAGILFKKLSDYGLNVTVSLNTKLLVDYRDDPAVIINLPPVNKQKHLQIGVSNKSSATAQVTSVLDGLMGVDAWDKVLSIIAGLYWGFYDVKAGVFTGIENSFLRELINNKILYEVTGLRVWGVKRKGLVTALARTLLPYIPGISGNPEASLKLVSEVFKGANPNAVRQKELTGDKDKDSLFNLVKVLVESTRDAQLAFKLIGDFYISIPGLIEATELEAHEVMGSLIVYESSCETCPLDVLLLPVEKSILPQIMSVYDDVADRVSSQISSQLSNITRGLPFEGGELIRRPDLVIDMLTYMNALPQGRVIKLSTDQGYVTSLRELIRVGLKPEEVYSSCGENQLCLVA